MKIKYYNLLILFIILIFSISCVLDVGSANSNKKATYKNDGAVGNTAFYPDLDIINKKINNVSVDMSYSLDNQSTWTQFTGSTQTVDLSKDNKVWVKKSGDQAQYLGQVQALNGRPDLTIGNNLYPGIYYSSINAWDDKIVGTPGDNMNIIYWFYNIGDTSTYNSNLHISFYLSTDKTIDASDSLLTSISYNYNCPVGELDAPIINFTVPAVAPGTYYIGCIIDDTSVISELNEDNNKTTNKNAVEFIVKDASAVSAGACKFINSWGTGSWENVADGHYWVTYQTMKKQKMLITYYYNNFSSVYEPRVIAVFKLTHPRRNECKVILGLGDPSSPYMKKALQSSDGSELTSGAWPFPNNNITVDISEFATAINDYDLFLSVENDGVTTGTINSFQVEFYSSYGSSPVCIKTITGTTGDFQAGITRTVYASTKGALNTTQLNTILPLSRATLTSTTILNNASLTEEKPSDEELAQDMVNHGVFEKGKNYNKVFYGQFGTGYSPPTKEVWNSMKKLRSVQSNLTKGNGLPDSLDNSATQYFPPIGNQGNKGSCTCFSLGYYIQTYTEAKEHGWNLSTTTWNSTIGAPNSNLDKIFSPDFIYNQINYGGDNGSNAMVAASLIIRLGGATWQNMPYNVNDSTSWPNEAAFRESGKYRGQEVTNSYFDSVIDGYVTCGYFEISDDSDINLLKSLLNAGYCVSTSIKAGNKTATDNLYHYLDSKDVIDTTVAAMETNHAQTIVGYKEGAAWNPLNP